MENEKSENGILVEHLKFWALKTESLEDTQLKCDI